MYYRLTKPSKSTLIGYTDDGSHWYRAPAGHTYYMSKEKMKEQEHYYTNPELMLPGYDPIWSYNWYHICKELDKRATIKAFIETLTSEQREELRK